jgi:hypothetical protein
VRSLLSFISTRAQHLLWSDFSDYTRTKVYDSQEHASLVSLVPNYYSVQCFNGAYTQNFIFFVTYEWVNKLEFYIALGWLARLARDKHSSFLSPCERYEGN